MSNSRNVLLTGIPRSGTTLAAALIDSLSDTVCLNEPNWQMAQAVTANAFASRLTEDFQNLRKKLLRGEPISDRRSAQGDAVTNYYIPQENTKPREATYQIVPFTRSGLSEHFTLAIKHNALYLATLEALIQCRKFTIIALVRHPVEVLHSWRSLTLPVSQGRLPAAEPYWPEMVQITRASLPLLQKHVLMYDLMCQRIYQWRDHIHLLPYEVLLKDPHKLSEYIGSHATVKMDLIQEQKKTIPLKEQEQIVQAFKNWGGEYAHFYPQL